MGAHDRGDDAAPVDVADQHHRHAGARREAHIGDVVGAQVDFGRRPRPLHDDEVGALAHLRPRVQHRVHQFRLERLVVARPRLARHAALHDHLRTGVGLRLEENGIHVDARRHAAGQRLQPLPAPDLAAACVAILGDGGVVGHVLRLERPHRQATVACNPAQAGDQDRLADIGAGALQHERTRHRSGTARATIENCRHTLPRTRFSAQPLRPKRRLHDGIIGLD